MARRADTFLTMNPAHMTAGGTAVFQPSREEYNAYLEERVDAAYPGLTVGEFTRRYLARQLDESDPRVSELVSLLQIGQNGDRPA